MKIFCLLLALLGIFISSSGAQGPEKSSEEDSLCAFLEGTYHLIGQLPDSQKTYSGKVVLKKTDGGLQVIRIIEGEKIKGVGKIEVATADKIKVLRVKFIDKDTSYEATYLINSDLDNYARLSGYLYLIQGDTKIPGLEALFIDHQTLK